MGLGLVKVLQFVIFTLGFLKRHLLRSMCTQNFYTKYGLGDGKSWAVVTGGTDGIGLEMCKQLAKMELNICIVARDEKKLKKVCSDLAEEFKIKTQAVVCDLGKIRFVQEYKEIVVEKIWHLDIAMVFLNAGTSTPGTLS